jgi:hypothetical protein
VCKSVNPKHCSRERSASVELEALKTAWRGVAVSGNPATTTALLAGVVPFFALHPVLNRCRGFSRVDRIHCF